MSMEVLWPWEIKDLTGKTALVIDFWAATSNIALFLGKGIEKIIVVNDCQIIEVKKQYKDISTVGESFELSANFFDYSNYPHDANKVKSQKEILYMTKNGTYVIELVIAKGARNVIAGSLLNFKAVCNFINNLRSQTVVIVPSGNRENKNKRADEDYFCADLFLKALQNQKINWDEQILKLKKIILRDYGSERRFREKEDFGIIFQLNKYNVVPICFKENWLIIRDSIRFSF